MAASASELKNSVSAHDFLTCPVCLDSYKDPRTLQCLHTFCTPCLESCRQPYRRDLSCPICKKVTLLSPHGIRGLQNDFRIQQIRDLLSSGSSSPVHMEDDERPASPDKQCELCKSKQKTSPASHHCVQCCIFFCESCIGIHQTNPLFTSHHVIGLSSENENANIFCKVHKEYAVRYFCKACNTMMCTICTMTHSPDHTPVTLDKHIISHHHKDLQDALRMTKSKLSDVKTKAKLLETLRQSYQKALFEAQSTIKDRTKELISQIKSQEQQLLQEVHDKIEVKMQELGLDKLGEINFHKANIESLHKDIRQAVLGSPQQCLLAYEDLTNRSKSLADLSLPTTSARSSCAVRFVPNEEVMQLNLGKIQEISLTDETPELDLPSHLPISPPLSPSDENGGSSPTSTPYSGKGVTKRMTSILNALSPSRKGDLKIGRVKGVSHKVDKPKGKAINADELIDRDSDISDEPLPSTSSAEETTSNEPTAKEPIKYLPKSKLIFKVDQIGGWPGKIMTPSSVDFLSDGFIIIAEGDNRLQVFHKGGQSSRIIGWGKIKPHGVAVMPDGKIAVTDKKEKSTDIFSADGEMRKSWGSGMFGLPAGIAIMSSGDIVVSDVDRHTVSIHTEDGSLLSQFGGWGSTDEKLNIPAYVAVHNEEIFVSDSCNGFIKIFDKGGAFIRKFSFSVSSSNQGSVRKPQGICLDRQGNILVADRENHRISVYNQEGKFIHHVLTRQDGIKYPCDVKINRDGQAVVVETHSGFLSKEPHHAVKLFQVHNQD